MASDARANGRKIRRTMALKEDVGKDIRRVSMENERMNRRKEMKKKVE